MTDLTPETRRILALLDALARVEALADEWASYAPSPWDEPAADLRAALRGPSDTEGQA